MRPRAAIRDGEVSARSAAAGWVVFACGGHRFGTPIHRVREIVTPLPFTRLPGSGPEVCGLIGLRGRVITVIDFGAAIGLRHSSDRADFRIVLVDRGDSISGLAVEDVIGVARTHAELDVSAEALRALDVDAGELVGVATHDEVPFMALDLERLFGRLLRGRSEDSQTG